MGRFNLGESPGAAAQRFEANVESLRALVDAGSPSIMRAAMEGRAVSAKERKIPLPSIGYRSGKLTITGYIAGKNRGISALIVQCGCGRPEYTVHISNFKNFRSTRCNLCAIDKTAADNRKLYWAYADSMPEDEHRERLLNRLSAAISRCHNESNRVYASYGGRGIFVCQEWRDSRPAFLKYARTLPGWDVPDYEMDRTDNNKGYEPGNIRFVSRGDNVKNRRSVSALQTKIEQLQKELADLRSVDGGAE